MNWLRVHVSPLPLDADLAAGTDPGSDPALASRARQLCSPRHRRRLASGLERLAREAESSREARDLLLLLTEALRGSNPLSPRGIAMVQVLLTDPSSPLYTDTAGRAVEHQVRAALDCL